MNKYQRVLIQELSYEIRPFKKEFNGEVHLEDNNFIIQQNENYNINEYILCMQSSYFTKIEYYRNKKWIKVKEKKISDVQYFYQININFKNRITKIKIHFNNKIAAPLTCNIVYKEADKDLFDAKIKAEQQVIYEENARIKRNEDISKVSIKVNNGVSMLNVLFQPLNKSYSYSEIELYYGVDSSKQFMGKYIIKDNLYFHSITDLAYGTYSIKLIQYNSQNKIIFESSFRKATVYKLNILH